MKFLLLFSSIVLFSFSCSSPKNISMEQDSSDQIYLDSLVQVYTTSTLDLTAEIRKQPSLYVTGIGPRARVYLKVNNLSPTFILNGEIICDYYQVYHYVENQIIKSIDVIQPRQSSKYGFRFPSGVILIKTESPSSAAE